MKAWETFLSVLEEKMGKATVDRWLRTLKIVQFDACNLYLEADHSLQIAWFEEHVRKRAETMLLNNNAHPIKIHFSTQDKKKKKKATQQPASADIEIHSDSVDASMTFSNFIYDEPNALTVRFFQELQPGQFNPIFLYGDAGIGKTHLLMACANQLQAQGLSVFYVHAETFTEHVVGAIRNSYMRLFRQTYRNQDVLIIDDVHHFARKNATQEELFHTFNALHTSGKQIILSSHLSPGQITDIEPRLISRFEWGIVLHLHPLAKEKMANVLQNKAHLHHFSLPNPVEEFLIEKFSTSSKSMMRALEALMMRHKHNSPISLHAAEHLLKDLLQFEQNTRVTPERILNATATYFGIRQDDILGKSQSKECASPRKIAMFLCRKKLHLPYLTIGKIFGRNHSTVMTNIRQIESASDEIENALEEIELLLNRLHH